MKPGSEKKILLEKPNTLNKLIKTINFHFKRTHGILTNVLGKHYSSHLLK